MQNLSVRITA